MEKFDVERFFKITFDIMAKIAQDLKLKKNTLAICKDELEKTLRFQSIFNNLLVKYEPQLIEKYDMTFNDYNRDTKLNQYYIDQYLENHKDIKVKFDIIKLEMKL